MRELEKGKQKFVEINGQQIPYDSLIKFYVDSDTGNWIVSTQYSPQTMIDLLQDAIDHFSKIEPIENIHTAVNWS